MQKLNFEKVGVRVLVGLESGNAAPGILLHEEDGQPVCTVFAPAGPRTVNARWATGSGDIQPGECVEHDGPAKKAK